MRKVKLHNPFKTRLIDEKLIREHLALERTKLANERTLLSYIRASIYLLISGLALLQVKEYQGYSLMWLGYLSLFICILFLLVGVSRYIALERKLNKLLREDNRENSSKSNWIDANHSSLFSSFSCCWHNCLSLWQEKLAEILVNPNCHDAGWPGPSSSNPSLWSW